MAGKFMDDEEMQAFLRHAGTIVEVRGLRDGEDRALEEPHPGGGADR